MILNTSEQLNALPVGALFRVENKGKAAGKVFEVFASRGFARYRSFGGKLYSTARNTEFLPARVLYTPEEENK